MRAGLPHRRITSRPTSPPWLSDRTKNSKVLLGSLTCDLKKTVERRYGIDPFSGPVAILVDEITASASEVFTGGLQEHGRIRVFGRTTAGQALPAVYHRLPNGDTLYHPIADFVTDKGVRFEGRGVVPDEAVPLNRQALLSGRDETLERALNWIDNAR